MNNLIKLSVVFFSLVLIGCQSNNQEKTDVESKISAEVFDTKNPIDGKNLMITNCYACHGNSSPETKRIAPPFYGIKIHYKEFYKTETEFASAWISYLENPDSASSLMPKAIDNFGIMPKFGYNASVIEKIAHFIFNNDMKKTYELDSTSEEKVLDPREQGKKYALSTKAQLGKNLMMAIKEQGTSNAVSFCAVHAYPITDSLAKVYDLSIKRVSDKPRNPQNKANETELGYINHFKTSLDKGFDIEAMVEETDELVNFYYPIITNQMCLQCHGEPGKNIDNATLTQLKSLYPLDKALGYDENQIRGIWSISWKKEG